MTRAAVRIEEMRQSLRIIEQCVRNMPEGPYKSDHPLTTPPDEGPHHARHRDPDHALSERELGTGDARRAKRSEPLKPTKGNNGYYLVSDGSTVSYRTRIRTPSFAHIQTLPRLSRGLMIPDLVVILGSLDFVLADVDR